MQKKRLKNGKILKRISIEPEKPNHPKRDPYVFAMELAAMKNRYVENKIKGRYYMARMNMLAVQIVGAEQNQKNEILELLDGVHKSLEYARAEYALTKFQAITRERNAFFQGKELKETYGLDDEALLMAQKDYYEGKVVREEYEENPQSIKRAQFIPTPTD